MMSSMVILKSNHNARLAEKVKTINVAQQQQNGSDCGVFVITYASSLILRMTPILYPIK